VGTAKVVPIRPRPDPVEKRLEQDRAFWKEEMDKAVKEYMAVCWKLAMYKQERDK